MTRTKSAARKLVTQQDRIDSLNESLSSARQDAARARDEQRQAERDQKRAERELANAEMRLRRARRDEAEALARQQDHLSDLEDEQRVIERFTGQPEDMLTFVEQAAQRGALIRADLGELVADVTPDEADRALSDTGSMATIEVLAMVEPPRG
ncbi:MAG: hypothetical protein LBE67_14060 [Kocuria palustris]|jgi:chromosome segregation ATPase|uniref:hypothetical protein n=1 Tax=Kocuria palustris TaxID=71999 RepID=UPI001D89C705|nr:hypothetical protein [Kocuria palustris]MBZ6376072.1 hypothetical protein [Kocuria palustris]